MFDLSTALSSNDLWFMILTAGSLGFLHTLMGPDHYLPFVMMARAQDWSRKKTAWVTLLCGLGHVGSSLVIGLVLAYGGMNLAEWAGSRWELLHEFRGNLSAWLLIGVGAAFTLWGIRSALKGRKHTHLHIHPGQVTHAHEHGHSHEHAHLHGNKPKSLTPWILFVIFIFGPCESLIPLVLASWSLGGLSAVAAVSISFSFTTIATIMIVVGVLLSGLRKLRLGFLEKWSTALAGISLILCGGAINWLGL